MSATHERLRRALNPRRIAFIGGSALTPAVTYCRHCGYAGAIEAVNPRRARIADIAAVPSVQDLSAAPDAAFVAVPKESVCDTVSALAAIECGAVICNSAGFSETEGGHARQEALVTAAGDMPVIGPNCPGIANFLDKAVLMMDHFGEHRPQTGVAVVSNGGAYLSDLGCADRSLQIAYLVGVGNQAMVSVADMLNVVLDDPRVKAANIYLESIRDVAELSQAAAKAARLQKPVVVVKGGRTNVGARAARSHTASLSTDASVASALFKRFGWMEAHTTSEALETLKMLTMTDIPRGTATGFITSSGSYSVLGADIAEREGLVMPPPSPDSAGRMRELLPDYAATGNPLDIADAQALPMEKQREVFRAFLQNSHDLVLQVMCYPPESGWDMTLWDATTEALALEKNKTAAAFVNTLPESLPQTVRERLAAAGVAPLQGMEDGIRAAAHAAHYGKRRGRMQPEAMILPRAHPPAQSPRQLNELESKQRLRRAHLQTPEYWILSEEEIPDDIEYPVALKAAVALAHKTEAGAVLTDIRDKAHLHAAVRHMREHLSAGGVEAEAFFAEKMITPVKAELLVGIRRIAGIGQALTMAIGGVTAELLNDAATVILPASGDEIEGALRGLRLFPLIGGWRGRKEAGVAPALDAIQCMISMMSGSDEVIELEVNPLILTGTRAIAVDAMLRVDEHHRQGAPS